MIAWMLPLGRAVSMVFAVMVAVSATQARAFDIQKVVSPGGVTAWLIRDSSVPVLSVSFAFRASAATVPADKAGAAYLAAQLLTQGAGDLDSAAFQDRLRDQSISMSFSAGRDLFQGDVYTLSENSQPAFELLDLALTSPRFEAADVERIRERTRTGLLRSADNPTQIAYRAWFRLAYGEHAYARSSRGSLETIDKIGVEDMRAFLASGLARDNLIVGVSGDIEPDALARLLDIGFGSLPQTSKAPMLENAVFPEEAGVAVIERPVPQTVAVFGQPGMSRGDPDWFAAVIVNYVLAGGSFSSRLMEEVREKNGLAYSVGASLVPYDRSAIILGQVATRNDAAHRAIDLVTEEWRRMAEQGLTAEELAAAKSYLTGSFPLSLDRTGRLADLLVAMQRHGLAAEYLDQRQDLINSVTLEQVNRVAKRLLQPSRMIWSVVGQPDKITPTLEAPEAG